MEVKFSSQFGILSPRSLGCCLCFRGHKFININIAPIQRSGAARSRWKNFGDNFARRNLQFVIKI